MSEGVQNPGDGSSSEEDVPPGQSAFKEHDEESHTQGSLARKCTKKRRHQESVLHQLQLQMQAMQQTLQGLVASQQQPPRPQDPWAPLSGPSFHQPYELCMAVSDSLYCLPDPQQLGTEEGSVSDQEDSSFESPPLDPTDWVMILRAAERARYCWYNWRDCSRTSTPLPPCTLIVQRPTGGCQVFLGPSAPGAPNPSIPFRNGLGSENLSLSQHPKAGPTAGGQQPLAPHFSSLHLAKWRLCAQCPWMLSTLESGYGLQFNTKYPCFLGVIPTLARDGAAKRAISDEILVWLEKGTIFCAKNSTYFLAPNKDGGFRPIPDLRGLNCYLNRLPFHMLRLSSPTGERRRLVHLSGPAG
ncbi:hypothetical protein SKAU_G00096740 [Synaphobranchus kaupii]|uniref:Uncharacterized protein n=1 Tax=Synaphobranchus kaupii TaxID=118154 RepID=A0A9Q1J701_SYNKA|nr:hypothetical protein SKAU_G00096740 [Synaphobranchus kaupii]